MEDKNIICSYCTNEAHSGFIKDNTDKEETWYCDDHFPHGPIKKYRREFETPHFIYRPALSDDPLYDVPAFGIRAAFDGITPKMYKALFKTIEEYKRIKNG